ncbi:MAG: ammonium transporter [Ilumatobacteraceae bacterium]
MESGNVSWVLISAALVLFMTPGLALFYGGLDGRKNMSNMMMMNVWALLTVPLLWAAVGYTLAQAPFDADFLGGLDNAFLSGMSITGEDGGLALAVFVFLAMFAVITPALISGAVAGRMKFRAWAIFVPVWSLLVYVPVFKWIYGGWLGQRGSLDFAGGTAIHVNAGVAALACVLVLGKRKGFPATETRPHSVPMVVLGAAILWFGWFGFNAGSALAANGTAIQAFVNTFLAASAAALAWVIIDLSAKKRASNVGTASGVVAGLVAITPAAGFVAGFSSVWIGLAAGVICNFAVRLKPKFGYDDALDVVGIHLVAGLVGSLLIGVFAEPEAFGGEFMAGLAFGGDASLLAEQALANLATVVYCFVVTLLIMTVLKMTVGVRVIAAEEEEGLDESQHGEAAYV